MWVDLFWSELDRIFCDKGPRNPFLDHMAFFMTETYLFFGVLAVLCVCVAYSKKAYWYRGDILFTSWAMCLLVVFWSMLLSWNTAWIRIPMFENLLFKTPIVFLFDTVILGFVFFFFLLGFSYIKRDVLFAYEYGPLFLFAVFGLLLFMTSNDLFILYLSMELQSLCLYVLAAYKTHAMYSTEAGIKYVVLGAVASGIFLMGLSFLYCLGGSTNIVFIEGALFTEVADAIEVSWSHYTYVMFSLYLVLLGLFFKVGVAPLHFWLPDVYEGAPLLTTAFFSVVPKMAIFVMICRMVNGCFGYYIYECLNACLFFGVLSIILGSVGALYQKTIKRLLAYSAIAHSGFILLAIACDGITGIRCMIMYLLIYGLMSLNIFSILMVLRDYDSYTGIRFITSLRKVMHANPLLGIFLILVLFSMAGIPPLLGFYSKLYVIYAYIALGIYGIAFIALFCSAISVVYYLYIVKHMIYNPERETAVYVPMDYLSAWLIVLNGALNFGFFFYSGELVRFLFKYVIVSSMLW